MEMKKLVLLALTALVAIPVFAQDEESNRVYTSSSGKAFIELVDHIGYGYHFIQSNDFTPAWSGEWFLNLVKFGIRPADVLGIDLGIDIGMSNFSSTQNAFTQVNQLIKATSFDLFAEGSLDRKRSGFNVYSLNAPVILKGIFGKFELGAGAVASWNFAGSTTLSYRKDNVRANIEEVKAKINPFTYGFLASATLDDFGVYFKYYPKSSKLLPEGSVDLSYMTLGLVIGF